VCPSRRGLLAWPSGKYLQSNFDVAGLGVGTSTATSVATQALAMDAGGLAYGVVPVHNFVFAWLHKANLNCWLLLVVSVYVVSSIY
jgi:hypothetical protein